MNLSRHPEYRFSAQTRDETPRLVNVIGPLDRDDLSAAERFHRAGESVNAGGLPYAQTFAWVFEGAVRYASSIPYMHPQGAVIWVRLVGRAER